MRYLVVAGYRDRGRDELDEMWVCRSDEQALARLDAIAQAWSGEPYSGARAQVAERVGEWLDIGRLDSAPVHRWANEVRVVECIAVRSETWDPVDVEDWALARTVALGESLTRSGAARLARVQPSTWSAMVSRGQAPQPTRRIASTPLWDQQVVQDWLATRPGQGARTDLRD